MLTTRRIFTTASVVTLGLLAVASSSGQDLKFGQARLATSAQYRTTDKGLSFTFFDDADQVLA